MSEESKEPGARATEADVQDALTMMLELAQRDLDDDDPMAEALGACRIGGVRSFDEAGAMTRNAGLVLALEDGSEFQITIVRSR